MKDVGDCTDEHERITDKRDQLSFPSATVEPFPIALAVLTRLESMAASSNQTDNADTRLEASLRITADVDSTIRAIHVPMTM